MSQPHFDVRCETAGIRALLREGLPPSAVSSLATREDVHDVVVERLHFSSRRSVQLQLTLQGRSGWRQSLIAEWMGPGADEHAQQERLSLCKSRRAQLTRTDTGGIVSIPEWGLVLRLPGLDARLPGLRLLHHPEEAAGLINQFSAISVVPSKVELVAHRLGKRAVLRVTTTENDVYYVRLRGTSSKSGCASFSRHMLLFHQLDSHPDIALPEPLGYSAKLGAAIFHQLDGKPLELGGTNCLSECRAFSRALYALQSQRRLQFPEHTASDEYSILLQLFKRTQRYFPELAQSLRVPLDWVGNRLRRIREKPHVLTHRDLHLKQLLMTEPGVGILDFDTVCLSHPALDIGNLQAHVYLESKQKGYRSEPLEAALTSELPPSSCREMTLWRCSALLRLAMIYAFTHESRHIVNTLINEVSSCRSA